MVRVFLVLFCIMGIGLGINMIAMVIESNSFQSNYTEALISMCFLSFMCLVLLVIVFSLWKHLPKY